MDARNNKRFWYGVHLDGERTSVVLWDRDNQPEPCALGHYVALYNLKANEIREYLPQFIRHHVRSLESDEYLLIDELMAGYFPALSRWKRELHAEKADYVASSTAEYWDNEPDAVSENWRDDPHDYSIDIAWNDDDGSPQLSDEVVEDDE